MTQQYPPHGGRPNGGTGWSSPVPPQHPNLPPQGWQQRPAGTPQPPPLGVPPQGWQPQPFRPAGPPAKKGGALTKVVAGIAIFVALMLALGGYLTYYDAKIAPNKVVAKPNAKHLTSFPSGRPPMGIGRMQLYEDTGFKRVYLERAGFGVEFHKESLDAWNNAKGKGWRAYGDLVCNKDYCMMAFSDAVLVIRPRSMIGYDRNPETKLYLQGLRGETPAIDWHRLTPPNANNLKPIAGLRFPAQLGLGDSAKKKTSERKGTDGILWEVTYGTGAEQTTFFGFKDYWLWGSMSEGSFGTYGNVMCGAVVGDRRCLLAGSDGFVAVTGKHDKKVVADLLNKLVP